MPNSSGERQAGALPFRIVAGGRVEVLLVTTSSGRWSPPKGTIDAGRSAEETAGIEALEEAGAIGPVLLPAMGDYPDPSLADPGRSVRLFALRVERLLDRWEEERRRQRQWFTPDDAIAATTIEALAVMLREFRP